MFQDAKWQLCSLLCLNKDKEVDPGDVQWFLERFEVPEKLKKHLLEVKYYCDFCKVIERYAFLFCKYYSGPGALLLTCLTCDSHDGKECTIIEEIASIEAKNLANQDSYMMVKKPSKN